MGSLLSPKPLSYLQQQGNGFSSYGRGLASFSETPPLTGPSAQGQLVPPNFPNNSSLGHNGGLQEDGKIYNLVIDLMNQNAREGALLELSKKREQYDDLALILWHSFGRGCPSFVPPRSCI